MFVTASDKIKSKQFKKKKTIQHVNHQDPGKDIYCD